MKDILMRIYEYLATYGLQIIAAIVIFVVGRWIAKLIAKWVRSLMVKAKVEEALTNFVGNLCYIALLLFVVIAALSKLGIHTTSFVAVVATAGLAVGLALQGALANFAAGVLLILFKPFKVGDFIQAAGSKGTVAKIQIFNTILNAPDNVRVIVPNAKVTGDSIMNYTVNGTRRVDLEVGVSYEDDLRRAQHVIEDVLREDTRILREPAPKVAVSRLGDSSVDFVVRPWVKCENYWDVYFDLTEKIKVSLDHNGITIPFPQRVVHVRDGKELAGSARAEKVASH